MENQNQKYIRYLYKLRGMARQTSDKEFFTYLIYAYYHFGWRYTTNEISYLLHTLKKHSRSIFSDAGRAGH